MWHHAKCATVSWDKHLLIPFHHSVNYSLSSGAVDARKSHKIDFEL